jgi:hypothetical protein
MVLVLFYLQAGAAGALLLMVLIFVVMNALLN